MAELRACHFEELQAHPGRGVCLPVGTRAPITDRVKRIVDMKIIQRLRMVRQLGFAHFTYPGAMHTRFEHTLGVYLRTCEYLKVLLAEGSGRFSRLASEQDVDALIVAALLHDAAHYPMAHMFEELLPATASDEDDSQRHDKLLSRALDGQVPGLLSRTELAELSAALDEDWSGVRPDDIRAIVTGHRMHASTITPTLVPVLHSILDGPLDADKLDYLQRDSLHTGNPTGMGIDERRLIDSLIVEDPEHAIGVRERGLAAAQTLLQARFSMFLTVYWHRATRARVRMFTEAIANVRHSNPEAFSELLTAYVFEHDDEGVLSRMHDLLPDRLAQDLIRPLLRAHSARDDAYVRMVTIRASQDSPRPATFPGVPQDLHSRLCYLFEESLTARDASTWDELVDNVRRGVVDIAGDGESHEILIDVPDPRYELPVRSDTVKPRPSIGNRFYVYSSPDLKRETVDSRAPLFGDLLENWRKNARKVRLFVAPRLVPRLVNRHDDLLGLIREAADDLVA